MSVQVCKPKTSSDLTVPSRNLVASVMPSLLKEASKISSTAKGAIMAKANGQPKKDPDSIHMIPCAVRSPPLQSMKAANPSMVVYMEKDEGRYEMEA